MRMSCDDINGSKPAASMVARHETHLPPLIPKVSVLVLAYNHELFIAQAIESALIQETDFAFEIVIGEDCSIDKTRDIVRKLQSTHPDKIRLLPSDRNLGMHRNYFRTLQTCAGEYVAVLEGDDFWTSCGKLQQQADFLDSHGDYVICFHNVTVVRDDGSEPPWRLCPDDQKETSTIEDLLIGNFIPTCATMFRNEQIREIPEWLYSLNVLDWPLHILKARDGLVGYLNQTMAAYRMHSGGAFSGINPVGLQLSRLSMYEALLGRLSNRHDGLLRNSIFRTWYALAVAYAKDSDAENAVKYCRMCLWEKPFGSRLMTKLKVLLRWKTPRLFSIAQALKSLGQTTVDSVRSLLPRNKQESIERRAGLETAPIWNARRQA